MNLPLQVETPHDSPDIKSPTAIAPDSISQRMHRVRRESMEQLSLIKVVVAAPFLFLFVALISYLL